MLSISTWWTALSSVEQIYWGIAIIASILFAIQMIISFIGLDADLDSDVGFDHDSGFSIISVRSLIAFFMFFGWGGIGALSSGFRAPQVAMIAFLIGFLAMVAVAYVFAQLLRLQESGTIDINEAIDKEGEVYLTIPGNKGGVGKISISLSGKTMEFDAVTTQDTLVTGIKVKVKNIDKENVMLVEMA
jgi:hypothetical protein